jgi:hypothetical protein
MRCDRARDYIGAWQDGELDPVRAWRIRRHVRRCADCAAESEALARLDADLRAAAPFGLEARQTTNRRAEWIPLLSVGAAALIVGVVFAAREWTTAAPISTLPSPALHVAAAPTPTPLRPVAPSEKTPRVTPAPKSTARAAVKPTPAPIRRPARKTQRRWPSPLHRPMLQRSLKPRIAPTPETDREVIMIAARPLTDEEILAQCEAKEEVIEICAEMTLPEMSAPPSPDDPMPMPESNP